MMMMIHVDNLKKGWVLSMFLQAVSSGYYQNGYIKKGVNNNSIQFRDLASRLTHGNTNKVLLADPEDGMTMSDRWDDDSKAEMMMTVVFSLRQKKRL